MVDTTAPETTNGSTAAAEDDAHWRHVPDYDALVADLGHDPLADMAATS